MTTPSSEPAKQSAPKLGRKNLETFRNWLSNQGHELLTDIFHIVTGFNAPEPAPASFFPEINLVSQTSRVKLQNMTTAANKLVNQQRSLESQLRKLIEEAKP